MTLRNHSRSSVSDYLLQKNVSHQCKNLYNRALYLLNQHYHQHKTYLSNTQLFHKLKNESVYQNLPSDTAQQVLRRLDKNYKSFFNSLKKGIKSARPPKYLRKDGYTTIDFIPRQIRVKDGKTRLTLGNSGKRVFGKKYMYVPYFPLPGKIVMIRIKPKLNAHYFEVHYVYEYEENVMQKDERMLSIDPGLNNFATCVSTNETAFLMEGRGIKSYNRFYNKKLGNYQSEIMKGNSSMKSDKYDLIKKRNAVMNNFISTTANYIIEHCLEENYIIMGDWDDMKRGLPMHRKTGQLFQQIPYKKFRDQLKIKCKLLGIHFIDQEESFTSQTCSGCGIIRKANRYKRIYRCGCGLQLNADINAAINIMRKVAPNALCKWSSRQISSPERIRVVKF